MTTGRAAFEVGYDKANLGVQRSFWEPDL